MIWTMLIPVIVFIIILIWIFFELYKQRKKGDKFDYSQIVTSLIFLFIYFQPGIFNELLGLISCRNIGGSLYLNSNSAYECYTTEHNYYIGFFVLPFLLIFMIIIPAIFAFKL
jgi:hypothetical protein